MIYLNALIWALHRLADKIPWLKKLRDIGAVLIVLAAIPALFYLTTHFKGRITIPSPFPASTASTSPQQPARNYTNGICDGAYGTDFRHDDETIKFFDVKLQDGCFSGFVGLPKNWTHWQAQLLHNDPNAWVAEWWGGWDKPLGPFTNVQLLSPERSAWYVPSNLVRLQGKGTIRFYCVTGNCPENQPGAESSPRRSSKPIPPVSNTSPNLDVVMDECHREAVPMLKCSGHISNKTDYLLKVAVGNSPVVDDDGNDVGVTPGMSMNHIQFTGDGGFTRLMPQVSTKFEFTLEDNYVKVRTLSMTLNFRVGTDEEQMFFFKDVPVY